MKNLLKYQSIFLAVLASVAAILVWLSVPAGSWGGKLWAVGASVCHQIPSHSFIYENLQFPLCARCTGLYLGSMIGLLYFITQGKKKAVPDRGYRYMLLVFFIAWAGDGSNSFINDLMNRTILYETSNVSRLITGFGMGLVMSTALMTLFNIVIWQESKNVPLLHHIGQVIAYASVSLTIGWFLINTSFLLFQGLSVASILTVLVVITMLYTVFWVIILKKENSFSSIQHLSPLIVIGLATALVQVMLLNWLRGLILS